MRNVAVPADRASVVVPGAGRGDASKRAVPVVRAVVAVFVAISSGLVGTRVIGGLPGASSDVTILSRGMGHSNRRGARPWAPGTEQESRANRKRAGDEALTGPVRRPRQRRLFVGLD